MAEDKIIIVKEEKKVEVLSDSTNGNSKLTLEEIKKLPPEKRIPALKKLEEDRRKELELANREEKKAVDELEEEKEKEEEEISLNIKRELDIAVAKLKEEQDRDDEKKKLDEGQDVQRKKSLEQELEGTAGTGKPISGTVSYSSNDSQLKDFYAVTTKVKTVLPGVLERMASHTASMEDERFLESYKNSMAAVRAETAYVSSEARQEFYSMWEQIDGQNQYHQKSIGEKQKKEEQRTQDSYRIDKR